MMETEKLYQMLKKTQEAKGYFFNTDKEKVFELLDALTTNKQLYGYMACPCRLPADDREQDRDIICPCTYREPDCKEYGSCYCNLYVTREWNENKDAAEYVPERRPPEKQPF